MFDKLKKAVKRKDEHIGHLQYESKIAMFVSIEV